MKAVIKTVFVLMVVCVAGCERNEPATNHSTQKTTTANESKKQDDLQKFDDLVKSIQKDQ